MPRAAHAEAWFGRQRKALNAWIGPFFRKKADIMRFYIAADNNSADRAKELSTVLGRNGHELTYDWMKQAGMNHSSVDAMSDMSFSAVRAIRDAELVVVLLPGGYDTNAELGVAIASRSNKRIILWSETSEVFGTCSDACAFCFHPSLERIVCPFEELLAMLNTDRVDTVPRGKF